VKLTVNGQEREAPAGTTVAGLLELLGLPEGRVAVERNGRIVPGAEHPATPLAEGDKLEIVQFVGGG
jgi:sulfur carrier protein